MSRNSLENVTLTLITMFYAPYTMRNIDNVTKEVAYSGLFFEAVKVLSEDLGFRYRVIEPPDGYYGVQLKNGSFNGMIGMLSRGEADMGIGGFTITSERRQAVDFLQPWWEEPVTYIMSKNPSSTMTHSFKPLSIEVWLLCIATVTVLTIICLVIDIPQPYRCASILKICGSHFYDITITALKQPLIEYPERGSMRLLLATWWLCSLIISVAYSANLVALMSVVVDSVPIRSLDELASQTHTKISLFQGTALHGMLKTTEIPLYKRIYENLDEYPETTTFSELLETRVVKGDLILLGELGTLKELRAESPNACKVALGKDTMYVQNIGFPVKKSFPYKKEFNSKIFQMIESGLMNKWRKDYMLREPYCAYTSSQAHSATLVDIFGAILVLAVGIGVSYLFLMFEVVISKIY